jgi:hypothetical protein
MKYILVILMIMNQLLTRKMKGGEQKRILWTRLTANFNEYRYDFLTILDTPVRVNQVVIYLKLDEEKKLVNMYLLLTSRAAVDLGKPWETLKQIPNVDNVKIFEAEFKMFHVDTMLIMFFKSDPNAEAFYRLEDTNYFNHDQLHDEWQVVVQNFENSIKRKEPFRPFDFKKKDANSPLTEIQTIISKARNTKIKSSFKHLKKRILTIASQMYVILYLYCFYQIRKMLSIWLLIGGLKLITNFFG